MIKDIFFVVKMLGLTVLIVIAMQVRIGEKTVEDHFHQWVKTSLLIDYIEEAVDGGVALTKAGYKKADTGIHGVLAKLSRHKDKKDRGLVFNLKRHNEKETDEDADLPQAKTHGTKIH